MLQRKSVLLASAAVAGFVTAAAAGGVQAQQPTDPQQPQASGEIINSEGTAIGSVNVNQLAYGLQIITAAENLPEGTHGFHIHETGACEPPDFESAGDHYNPTDMSHGFMAEQGPHAGDLPNVYVAEDGILAVEFVTDRMSLTEGEAAILDDDGAALVIHENADDYTTDPAGESGTRIACAVIEARTQQ